MEDNRLYFTLNIPDKHNIAIISNSSNNAYYIKESLNAFDNVATLVTTVDGSPWILQPYFEAKCSRVKAVLDKILIPQHIDWPAFN